jgi:hypothetical protein
MVWSGVPTGFGEVQGKRIEILYKQHRGMNFYTEKFNLHQNLVKIC